MLRQLSDIGNDEEFDCCVVGTGPAGITCALTLASSGKKIALLEGGSDKYSEESQDLYNGTTTGDTYRGLTRSRLRFFGGTSNHWAGWCRPLDKWDFRRKGHANTEWPISKRDLDPYLDSARDILDLPRIPDDRRFGNSGLNQIDFVWSPPYKHLYTYFPVRFLQKFYSLIVAHKYIHLILDANLTRFDTNGRSVTGANISSLSGVKATVRSRYFVLATGGIENSRILLWSNARSKGELIKNDSSLGRYWMEHPHFTLGYGFVASHILDDTESSQRRRMFLSPTPSTIRRHNILNCGLRVDEMKEGQKEVIDDFAAIAPNVGRKARELFENGMVRSVRIRAAWEQEPTASNSITLIHDTDALGMPRVNLNWHKNELDRRTARVTAQQFGQYLAEKDVGRIRLDPWVLGDGDFPAEDELGGNHHMGGTRMAHNSDLGVVDENCKVFDQENLYVAGSSVFPSGGHCNPTLTIVQLSTRLGEHLKSKI